MITLQRLLPSASSITVNPSLEHSIEPATMPLPLRRLPSAHVVAPVQSSSHVSDSSMRYFRGTRTTPPAGSSGSGALLASSPHSFFHQPTQALTLPLGFGAPVGGLGLNNSDGLYSTVAGKGHHSAALGHHRQRSDGSQAGVSLAPVAPVRLSGWERTSSDAGGGFELTALVRLWLAWHSHTALVSLQGGAAWRLQLSHAINQRYE